MFQKGFVGLASVVAIAAGLTTLGTDAETTLESGTISCGSVLFPSAASEQMDSVWTLLGRDTATTPCASELHENKQLGWCLVIVGVGLAIGVVVSTRTNGQAKAFRSPN